MDSFSNRKQLRLMSGESDRLTDRAFNLVLTGLLAYGLFLNAVIVYFCAQDIISFFAGKSIWMVLLAYAVPTVVGILLAVRSDNPVVSFLGYNLVVLPVGVLLALIIPGLPVDLVVKAMLLTAMVTVTMMLLSIVRPSFFLGIGRTLFVSLLVGLLVEVVATWLFHYHGALFDWLFVILFSGYVGYDVAKSQAYPKTLDNAIDSALDIYLDVINLFIRILSILGRRD